MTDRKKLRAAVEAFSTEMEKKLLDKLDDGFFGWDMEENDFNFRCNLMIHLEKKDYVDVGNFAMFLWLQQLNAESRAT